MRSALLLFGIVATVLVWFGVWLQFSSTTNVQLDEPGKSLLILAAFGMLIAAVGGWLLWHSLRMFSR